MLKAQTAAAFLRRRDRIGAVTWPSRDLQTLALRVLFSSILHLFYSKSWMLFFEFDHVPVETQSIHPAAERDGSNSPLDVNI